MWSLSNAGGITRCSAPMEIAVLMPTTTARRHRVGRARSAPPAVPMAASATSNIAEPIVVLEWNVRVESRSGDTEGRIARTLSTPMRFTMPIPTTGTRPVRAPAIAPETTQVTGSGVTRSPATTRVRPHRYPASTGGAPISTQASVSLEPTMNSCVSCPTIPTTPEYTTTTPPSAPIRNAERTTALRIRPSPPPPSRGARRDGRSGPAPGSRTSRHLSAPPATARSAP